MHLSVVIPVYNSATSINQVVGDCFAALSHLDFEIVLVDDGSTDNSEAVIFQLAQQHPNIKAISLAKNVGEFNAVMCGLRFATGKYVAIIDDDGQNPPAEILKLLARAESGYDVVYAQYAHKMHAGWRNAGSGFSNYVAWLITNKSKDLYLSSFKVLRADLVQKVTTYTNANVYPDVLVLKYAKNTGTVAVEHKAAEVKSRYTFKKLVSVFASMLITRFGTIGQLLFYLLIIVTIFPMWLLLVMAAAQLLKGSGWQFSEHGLSLVLTILLVSILPKTKTDRQFEIKRSSF
jgi:undecaprenyl-phosphate 4-deoxy-4-formamido-L-arabinose transferase